jgi:hypothetical protein
MNETKLTTENVYTLAEKRKKMMPHNSRAVIFLMLPIVIFIWFIGWTLTYFGLTYLGAKQKSGKAKVSEKREIAFAIIAPEQEYVIQSDKLRHLNRGKTLMPIPEKRTAI